jgi:hypothetical protein
MAGFSYRGQLNGAQNPVTADVVIGNTVTVTVGDAITVSGGFAALASAGSKVFGVVAGIVDTNGIDLDNASTSNYDGTWTSSSQTYVSASDNQTDKQVRVKVIVDPFALFYNDADGSLAITDEYLFFDVTSESQISASSGTTGAFQLWKRDPDGDGDASKGIFRFAEWFGTPYTQD